ncbi:hypothetical protein BRC92_05680 [Halobacteriales archaeon QS_4_69_31]|nr:MAG: hypothetical protein BRC92_05680 [Halobacteriales archaeon QS_4_69_31]
MPWQQTPYAVPLALASVLGAVAAGVVWVHRDSRAETWGALVQLSITLWALVHLGLVTSAGAGGKRLFLGLVGPVAATLSVTMTGFTLVYAGRGELLTRRRTVVLAGFPVAALALAVTNGAHGLLFADLRLVTGDGFVRARYRWGAGLAAVVGVSYALAVVYLTVLYRRFRHSRNVYRSRNFVILASTVVLTGATVVSTLGASPFPHYTLMPILYLFIGVVLVLTTTSHRFLRSLPVDRVVAAVTDSDGPLVPLARDVIVEEADFGVVVFDTDGRVVDVNTTGRKMLGTDRAVGRRLADIVDPAVFQGDTELRGVVQGDADLRELREQVWVATPIGERCYDVSISELGGRGGEVAGYAASMYDITAQKRQEEQLRDRERELEHRAEQLQREKSKLQHQNDRLEEFASMISHDLRNPLNVADGHLQLVEDDLDGRGTVAVDAETVRKIRAAHERMERLVDDTLALAREGKVITDPEPMSLDVTAREAWDHVDAEEATLSVETDARVESDSGHLLTLFENLFRNAVEHGGEDVRVRVGRRGDDEFYVADDGEPIPDHRKEEVLERGFSTSRHGTGLGLAIAYDVAGAHGWHVAVEDSDDGGTRIVFGGVGLSDPVDPNV